MAIHTIISNNQNLTVKKVSRAIMSQKPIPIPQLPNLVAEHACPNFTMAEIGVFDGVTTATYIDIIRKRNGHLYVVDWFKGSEKASGVHAFVPHNKEHVLKTFKKNLDPYLDIITILEGHTHEMIPKIPDHSLDFCFIDASHKYSDVKIDIELCKPKVKPGGILSGHDCETFHDVGKYEKAQLESEWDNPSRTHPGVIQAVYDHFEDKVTLIPGPNIWWIKL